MFRRVKRRPLVRRLGEPMVPLLMGCLMVLSPNSAPASDILRSSSSTTAAASGATAPATVLPAAAPALTSAQDRLARTTQALQAVKQMQAAARNLALAGPNNLLPSLPAVPVNSYLQPNGLIPAAGVPKDLSNPVASEDPTLWNGASLPVATTQDTNGATTSTVTITQTQQQSILNWQSFNIGKSTTLAFDQTAGGTDIGNWIAFNKIGVTGSPSQILGSIQAGGQVYVINPNGIIFGGSSQVNAHALVASALPINDNLIARGLLNNPDDQFLFSTLSIAAGSNGTPAFNPSVSDAISLNGAASTYTLALKLAAGTSPVVSYVAPGAAATTLTVKKDFTVGPPGTDGRTTLSFTASGLQKVAGATVNVSYTPAGDQYGNVVVQAGAQLTAPTTADHIGGRIALVAPNVTNAGTISTADGQAILAAGLQVGLAAHSSSDASLRGLDVYVGAVADPALAVSTPAGTTNTSAPAGNVTNAGLETPDIGIASSAISSGTTNPAGLTALGLIEAPRGDIFLTGQNVSQLGAAESTTSVAYNGRIDLVAAYNAVSSRGINNAPPFFWRNSGSVLLGSGSVTGVQPELASTDKVVGTTLALPSRVTLQGGTIELAAADGADPGATLLAPNADVTASAGNWRFTSGGLDPRTGFPLTTTSEQFIYDGGSITAGSGASIDVSGSEDVSASVAENIVAVQLRGPELANSPLQRDGPLRGQTIQVDIRETGTYNGQPWVGTPLADTSGYIGLVQRSVGELTVGGGTVTLKAGDSVALQAGSSINVSGGWINYAGAAIQTTKLGTLNGHIIDISRATPDQVYAGIYTGTTVTTDPKWGTTQASSNPLSLTTYDPGYTQGGSGGTLAITAPSMTLAGSLAGRTSSGGRQINPFIPYASPTLQAVIAAGIDPRIWELGNLPAASTLSLVFEKQYAQAKGASSYPWYSPAPPDIYILPNGSAAPADSRALVLPASLVDPASASYGGFGNLRIDDSADNYQVDLTNKIVLPIDPTTGLPVPGVLFGAITVGSNPADPANVTLRMAPGGSLVFDAANIDLEGGVVAPGGQLSFTAHNFWQGSTYNVSQFGLPAYNPDRGNFILSGAASLSTAGLTVDERRPAAAAGPLVTGGGSVAIFGSDVTLRPGSVVSVDGGATINAAGKVAYGGAGTITLGAGSDPGFGGGAILGGALTFDVAGQEGGANSPGGVPLQGYSGATGGTVSVVAPLIQVGDMAGAAPPAGTLRLSPDFFNNGGFSTFALQGQGRVETDAQGNALTDGAGNNLYFPAVEIARGTTLHPRTVKMIVEAGPAGFESGFLAPLSYQATPVSLKFAASGVTDTSLGRQGVGTLVARGDLVVDAGAVVETDPAGSVSLTGQTVTVLGSISAPGGAIAVKGGTNSAPLFYNATNPLPTVDLGPQSSLSTAGTTVLTADARGRVPGSPGYVNTGSVLSGGSISVTGNIVAESGSVLDVSGWSDSRDAGGLLNLSPAFSGMTLEAGIAPQGLSVVPTVVDTSAGSIAFIGGDEFFSDATLKGAAGGPAATGGSLSLTVLEVSSASLLQTALQITQSSPAIPAPSYGPNRSAIGHPVLDANGNPLAAAGYFAADNFARGGFDNLALNGNVSFQGPVTIAATGSLSVATGGILTANAAVTLNAAYVALGQPYLPPPVVSNPYILYNPVPQYGAGTLSVTAGTAAHPGLIDLGNLSLQNIGQAALVSTGGDIRGYGIVDVAGSLSLTAGQVYPVTAETLTIAAYDYRLPGDKPTDPLHPGSVAFTASGSRQVPLSAGGTLNVFGSNIDQGGVLRAPIGTINLGWDGAGTAPFDPITNTTVAVTRHLTLDKGSLTSVSASVTDSVTGQNLPIPYGVNLNGSLWVDPTGADITNGGLPSKAVSISAGNVSIGSGALIDTGGGGDLYAYQFVKGVGGTTDILSATSPGFAVIPGYQPAYAPDAAFNHAAGTDTLANLLQGVDPGYISVNTNGSGRLAVGDQIHIDLGNGQGPQNYTLLPARYALLPGAYLITPATGLLQSVQAVPQPDGSTVAVGYRFNAFDPSQPLYGAFDVAPESVVRTRAQYGDNLAGTFFGQNAAAGGTLATRLPADGGQVIIAATSAMTLQGSVSAAAAPGGRGGLLDISSPDDVVINAAGTGTAAGTLYLSSAELSGFSAGSLLIGGTRTAGADGTTVNVTANNLTVDNAGQPLTGADLILVANDSLTLAPGAQVEAKGTPQGPAEALQVIDSLQLQPATGGFLDLAKGGSTIGFPQGTPTGDTITSSVSGTITLANGTTKALAANKVTSLAAGSSVTLSGPGRITSAGAGDAIPVTLGDGALLRVSSAAVAPTARSGIASSTAPLVQVGAGATVTGNSVTLDSTYATKLDPTAALTGGMVSLDSGQISLVLDAAAANAIPPNSLVLSGAALARLQTGATGLSLLSYSSIDTYGSGQIGTPTFSDLALHAGEIRGFNTGANGNVVFSARNISLDNSPAGAGPGAIPGPILAGTLTFDAETVTFGANQVVLDQFANVQISASGGILATGSGALTTPAGLTISTPVLAGASGANQTITTGGALAINAPNNGSASVSGGLGASLTLVGSSVAANSNISLPSGTLTLHATGPVPTGNQMKPDVTIAGTLDVGGATHVFEGTLASYTDAGQVTLISDHGSVNLSAGASINVSAQAAGGNAGAVAVSAPNGSLNLAAATPPAAGGGGTAAARLDASNGHGGSFSLDVANLNNFDGSATASLNALETTLTAGNFTQAQNIRVRTGDVTVDGTVKAATFNLAADQGSIEVTKLGFIDASGPTGGAIDLASSGSITLESGAVLSVKGQNFNNAGTGGTVSLAAGSYTTGNAPVGGTRGPNGGFGAGVAVVDIQPGSTIDLSVVNNHPVELNPGGVSSIGIPAGAVGIYFPSGTPGNDEVAMSSNGTITTAAGVVTAFAATPGQPYTTALAPGSAVTLAGPGTIAFASGSGGSIPVDLPSSRPDGSALNFVAANTTDLSAYNSTGTLHLRAPQVLDQSGNPYDVQINPIQGAILNPSGIMVEGYRVFDLTVTGGLITDASTAFVSQPSGGIVTDPKVDVRASVEDNGALFAGGYLSTGASTAGNTAAISAHLLAGNAAAAALSPLLHLRPGAEIVSTQGNLTLQSTWDLAAGAVYYGTGDPAVAANWDFAVMPYRFGPDLEPGYLTLRAQGNLIFGADPNNANSPASLNDGFGGYDGFDNGSLWTATLLPAGSKSWSFRLVAGADFTAADPRQVLPMARLAAGGGSVLLGQDTPALKLSIPAGTSLQNIIPLNYQTIRTGTGDVGVYAGRDVQILNNLATIYTAGSQTAPLADFSLPANDYPAQYPTGGGNVTIFAQGDIAHLTATGSPDSSKELPMNWLSRRGWVNPLGQFGSPRTDTTIDSTSWWIDYSNFFEGVGALGGGSVTLLAGHNISNMDAVVPTNERTSRQTTRVTAAGATIDVLAIDQPTLELGGGDLTVHAGNDIDGGVYYVERGAGTLQAGGSIHTNSTRVTLSQQQLGTFPKIAGLPDSQLPTSLFLGQGSFTIVANGDLLLGPVANPFLLPQSLANGSFNGRPNDESTFFSTYATGNFVNVSSLTGAVTLKDHPDISNSSKGGSGSLLDWLTFELVYNGAGLATTAYTSQPWLSLFETDIAPFTTVAGVMPASLRATAFAGDINLVGSLELSPAPHGQVALAAAGSINGVRPNAVNLATGALAWASGMVNLSDADPSRVPGLAQPLVLSFPSVTTAQSTAWADPGSIVLPNVDSLFNESGSTTGAHAVLQTKQALHASGPLHADDPVPVVFYAEAGDISGLTLFAGKSAQVIAGQDISDIALYLQNNRATDVTTVAAGRDLILYDPNSALRTRVQQSGQQFFNATSATAIPASGTPTAGDIQIGGPGTLEVLAGRNLTVGVGAAAPDGTSVGIRSIGNTRNPSLPFAGASIVAAAGIGGATGLEGSQLDFASFINAFLNPATAGGEAAVHLSELGSLLGLAVDPKSPQAGNTRVWAAFSALSPQQQDQLALDVFYLVLRNAGRDHNNLLAGGFGNYNDGYEAVATLFSRKLDYSDASGTGFVDLYLNPATAGAAAGQYLPALGVLLGAAGQSDQQVWQQFGQLPADRQHELALRIFSQVLASAAQELTNSATNAAGKAAMAQALGSLFHGQKWVGNISLATREIETTNGGDINLLAPGGQITVGLPTDPQKPDQGILTGHGGNISVFASGSVNVGTSRIFTLRGGDEIIWSTAGNIAAGSGSKTVFAAPPTRVLIDPQSGNVQNDLAGLATGSGIGVLATLQGVSPGNVDLIAPVGTVDAGDAGIRASGNLNIAAAVVLNASNIQVGGTTVGTPPPPPAPALGSLTAASSASASASSAAADVAKQGSAAPTITELPSIISVEVLGFGGGDEGSDANAEPNNDENRREKKHPSF